ncbi:MAG: hypothetical protein EA409_00820 [Saprospirales bacterium]|nr:MAG: hypothetical protein EA409_00820 [Saprospirales bacterium]
MNDGIPIDQPHVELSKTEIRIENEAVWLNRHQVPILLDRKIKSICKHINNALKKELETVAKFATVQLKLASAFFAPTTTYKAVNQ